MRLKPAGTVDREIPDTFTKIAGDMDIVGAFHYLVLKYTADGNYVDQFGGEAKSGATDEPGNFVSPQAIAVDGHGRIYVSDFLAIQAFDASGTYLNRIPMDQGVAFSMAFDDQNRLYVVTSQSHVMRQDVQPPSEQSCWRLTNG